MMFRKSLHWQKLFIFMSAELGYSYSPLHFQFFRSKEESLKEELVDLHICIIFYMLVLHTSMQREGYSAVYVCLCQNVTTGCVCC